MVSNKAELQHQVLELIDNANGSREQQNQKAAVRQYARAAELLLQWAEGCKQEQAKRKAYEQGVELLEIVTVLKEEASGAIAMPNSTGERKTLADIGGLDDVKERLRLMVIEPRKHAKKYAEYGVDAGGGLLLFGPPGTGKTLLAKAIAGELGLPFFAVRCSKILGQFYGESEQRLAKLFEDVRSQPDGAVMFIDEIDSIGISRASGEVSEPSRRVLNQLLQELDGFDGRPQGVLLLAATNTPWLLDGALIRPGRFDHRCHVPLPDESARASILQVALRKCCHLDNAIDLARIASLTDGYSGADLAALCEEAKRRIARRAVKDDCYYLLGTADLDEALAHVQPSVDPNAVEKNLQFANKNKKLTGDNNG